jgi:hypothetical protein
LQECWHWVIIPPVASLPPASHKEDVMERDELKKAVFTLLSNVHYGNVGIMDAFDKFFTLLDGWESPEEVHKAWQKGYIAGKEFGKEGQP